MLILSFSVAFSPHYNIRLGGMSLNPDTAISYFSLTSLPQHLYLSYQIIDGVPPFSIF